jgi:ubiquitin C-terminal hydrolase
LQNIKQFNEFIINNNFNDDLLLNELSKLFNFCNQNKNTNISPVSFKKKIANINSIWGELEYQDSQEFLSFLISTLDDELLKIIKIEQLVNCSKIRSKILGFNYYQNEYLNKLTPIKDLFFGILISSIKCDLCNSVSHTFELFITVPLSIKITETTNITDQFSLNECINNFVLDEKLDYNNMITCDTCHTKNQSIKKILFWKTPQILIFQLIRFWNGIKIINQIIYPEFLNMSLYFHSESPFKHNCMYKLIGINLHHEFGRGNINAGHYLSIVELNNKWYIFNDSENLIELNNIQNKDAYLLFYINQT